MGDARCAAGRFLKLACATGLSAGWKAPAFAQRSTSAGANLWVRRGTPDARTMGAENLLGVDFVDFNDSTAWRQGARAVHDE